jgi:hypothetical protein
MRVTAQLLQAERKSPPKPSQGGVDEERLVRLVAEGDLAAFEELYRRTSPWLAVWRAAGAFAGASAGGTAVGIGTAACTPRGSRR